jgi:uncharacterized protein YodC (DUF2158 family)
MKRQFRPGSVVKLKSGSSNMIVIKYEMQSSSDVHESSVAPVSATQTLVCVTWFEYGKWKSGRFDPDLLVLTNG